MKLEFDRTGCTQQVVGSITFTDYPNQAFTVEINGRYFMIKYHTGDSIFIKEKDQEYYVSKIVTHDGLTFTYKA